jgi:hypothetical protein
MLFSDEKRDDYSLGTLYLGGWFSANFADSYSPYPYIGARALLTKMMSEKGLLQRIVEAVAQRATFSSILRAVTAHFGLPALQGSTQDTNKLAKDLIAIFDDERAKKTISSFLVGAQRSCNKQKRFFTSVERYGSGERLVRADYSQLRDKMVVIESGLVHRATIAQYNPNFAQTAAKLGSPWMLSDLPPHAMVEDNDEFHGKVVSLALDDDVEAIFKGQLPFDADIGWYPYCRVTGFFVEGPFAPLVTVALLEYRKTQPYFEVAKDFINMLASEQRNLIYLDDASDRIMAAYVLPMLAAGSAISQLTMGASALATVAQFRNDCGSQMPAALQPWYEKTLATPPTP